jgi:CBS domain-containing protein
VTVDDIEQAMRVLAGMGAAPAPDDRKAALDFAEARRKADEDPRERQRIRDIADLVDAEDAVYAQAVAAVDRGDLDAAEPLLRMSAEAGIGDAAWLLGGVLEKRGRIGEALVWYRRAAVEGDSRADEKIAELNTSPGPRDASEPTAVEGQAVSVSGAGKTWPLFSLLQGSLTLATRMEALDACDVRIQLAYGTESIWDDAARRSLAGAFHPAGRPEPAWRDDPVAPCCLIVDGWEPVRPAPVFFYVKTHGGGPGAIWLGRPALDFPLAAFAARQALPERHLQPGRHCNFLVERLFGHLMDRPGDTAAATRVRVRTLKALMAADCEPGIIPLIRPGRRDPAPREETAADMMLPLSSSPAVGPEATVYEALGQMLRTGDRTLLVTLAPVIGAVTLADLALALHEANGAPSIRRVATLMQTPVIVPAGMPASQVMSVAAENRADLLVVTNDDEDVIGYLTTEALLTRAADTGDDRDDRGRRLSQPRSPVVRALPPSDRYLTGRR